MECSICHRNNVRLYECCVVDKQDDYDFKTNKRTIIPAVKVRVCGTDMNLINRIKKQVLDAKRILQSAEAYRKEYPIHTYDIRNEKSVKSGKKVQN